MTSKPMHQTIQRRARRILKAAILMVAVSSPSFLFAEEVRYEVALLHGTIHRGDGSEPLQGHVGIREGRIAYVAAGDPIEAEQVIDCTGLVIAPGFIDLHNHSDEPILKKDTRTNANYLLQGCTTIVTGNCGGGHVDVDTYLKSVDKEGAGTHVAHLLPQGSLRRQVMGSSRRDATPQEMAKMIELAEKAMTDGAFGMSTGLIYVPGTFTPTEELIEISRVVSKHGGIYASHIRSEGAGLLDSIDEAVRIGREAELPVHVSHLKASGKANWGTMRFALQRIEEARKEGLKVTADQYPYPASSTSLEATLFPTWSRDGGASALKKRIDDPEEGARLRAELEEKIGTSSRIQLASCSYNPKWIGRSLDEISQGEGIPIVDVVVMIQRNGGAQVVNFGMDENDMRLAMPVKWVATASDGGAKVPSKLQPHPRSFGTFPRKIGRYARDLELMPLADAIRSCSGLPAEILGLKDRGLVEAGLVADLVVFAPETFIDQATYNQPYLPPTGISHVLVAGKFAVYQGQVTGILAGKGIRKTELK